MDENLAWKIIYIAAIFSLIIMVVAYLFISPSQSPYFTDEKTDKIAEFKDARLAGRKTGRKVWELTVKEGWTSKNHEINYLYDVSHGQIFMDEQLVVAELSAPFAKAYRRTDMIEVYGRPEGRTEGKSLLHARLDLRKISTQRQGLSEWARITADYLKYLPQHKATELSGSVQLHKKDSSIYSDKIRIDHEQRVAEIHDNISIRRQDGRMTCDKLRYYGPDEKLVADNHIDLNVTETKLKTRMRADHATFYSDMNRDMVLVGNVEAVQGKKLAIGDNGIYSQPSGRLLLNGNVKAVFEKAAAVLKDSTVKQLRNKEATRILKEKTVLTSDSLIIFTRSGNAQADGHVLVTQQTREAKADQAVYDDNTELLTLSGNVYLKKMDEWVSARQVVISVKDETFGAVGSVEAEFKL
ncbi:MAG: hypothetical protein JW782_01440 [Candidatus Saganbacteria bacterium]|nr:hypothetical protein [Candidatus Saganbacteria bacterium]